MNQGLISLAEAAGNGSNLRNRPHVNGMSLQVGCISDAVYNSSRLVIQKGVL